MTSPFLSWLQTALALRAISQCLMPSMAYSALPRLPQVVSSVLRQGAHPESVIPHVQCLTLSESAGLSSPTALQAPPYCGRQTTIPTQGNCTSWLSIWKRFIVQNQGTQRHKSMSFTTPETWSWLRAPSKPPVSLLDDDIQTSDGLSAP